MATEEYWHKRREFLLNSEHSPLARLPMTPEALMANGPMMAVGDALSLLILGLRERAQECLEFVPRLKSLLSDPNALAHLPEYRQRESATHLREYLHLGTWLLDGEMNPLLARDAYRHLLALNQWWGRRITQPNLHDLMLLCIEGDDLQAAGALYLEHERHPLVLPPADLRFSSNARSVLYVCLARMDNTPTSVRSDALDAFRRRASRWERSASPIPYVMPVELARTLRACNMLLDRSHDLATILPLVT
jgi:hypothetical protein